MNAPGAILIGLGSLAVTVWIVTTVVGYLRRNAEANERIANALEEANTLARTRGRSDP
jgi:hypothetical protein